MVAGTLPKLSSSYKWTLRIIGFIWMFLTACFAILNIFVFVQPQWIGDTLSSPRAGHFGLYSYCVSTISDFEFDCQGTWTNFSTLLNIPFKTATFFVGFSVLLILICLLLFTLFIFLPTRIVYFIAAVIQFICAICLLIAIIIYPFGFDDNKVRFVCGLEANDYNIGTCQIRWAYILAVIALFNVSVLGLLGLFLALKQPKPDTMQEVVNPNHVVSKYGELHEAIDDRTFSEQTIPTTASQRR